MGIIRADGLVRTYQMGKVDVPALRGVTFSVSAGEFVGIMGPSGSGKSTLLHQIGLLDRPTSGNISIGGQDVGILTEYQRCRFRLDNLGYVFQDYALIPELTTIENVILLPMAQGISEPQYMEMGRDVLGQVGLGERFDHLPAELSGGEQQRVAIARALVKKPEIIFADEPCANLDSQNSRKILELFREVNERGNQTIVMVSHEEEDTEFFDRVILLYDGNIVDNP
jgi:putative ABC transport system ATP-binding protein